ncbi:MAG TPA: heparinase II/III family protein [Bryobacteraceae bacterium]|nr:heparinase II/III family protein [Bryobacteraceae bacterium]
MRELWIFLPALALAAQSPVPYHYAEDFASGQASGWTSYPPVQDVAYDPSLSPIARAGGFSMGRILRPTRDGALEIGLIRRMSFLAGPGLRISFQLSLEPAGTAAEVEVGLAARSGRLYRAHTAPGAASLAADTFGVTNRESIEAVYILSRIRNASAAVEYTLRLDAVELDALRPSRAAQSGPPLVNSRGSEKRVAARAYGYSDDPPIRGARLFAPDGTIRAATGRFSQQDAPGLWEAQLPDGSRFAFLLLGKRPGEHPRVFDMAELRGRVGTPEFATPWKQISERAARSRNIGALPAWAGENILRLYPDHLLPALNRYSAVLDATADLAISNALVAAVEEKPEAREAARKALLAAASFPTWTPPWFSTHGMHTYYQAGIFARNVALAYDLAYPYLSESERIAVRRALGELGTLPTFREHFLDARLPFATSNWIANSLSGAIVATAVCDGEPGAPDQPGLLTGLVASLREHVNETILADGSSGEPLGYEDFDLEGVSWSMAALQRAYGIDFQPGTALATAHVYAVYDQTSARECPDMGDGSLHSTRGFAWLARRNADARLRRLYKGMRREPVGELVLGPSGTAGDEPSLAPSRYFDRKGAIVLRGNWQADATVFALRAGPNYNHNHMDAGGFLLSSHGEPLLSEAGVTHYYNDPHYKSHFIQAVGHNVMLVDGNPESQTLPDFFWVKALNRRPVWGTVLLSEAADLFDTELRSVYRASLDSYRRAVIYVRPGYFVLCDRVSARQPHAYSWLFHAPAGETRLRLEPAGFAVERSAATLHAKLIATSPLKLSEHEWPAPVAALEALPVRKVEVRRYLEAGAARASSAAMLAVLCPLAPGEAAPAITELRGSGSLGVRVGDADLVAFRTGTGALAVGELATDGDSVFLRSSGGGAVERLAVDRATRVTWRGRELLSASGPVSLAVRWEGGAAHGTLRSARAAELTLNGARMSVQAGETLLPMSTR